MRKVKFQMQLSLDGFVAGPNGEMDWMVWNWDEALKKYVGDITDPVDCILLGRKLAEGFIPHWKADSSDPADLAAQKFTNTPKIVFSRTLKSSEWENTTIENGDVATTINKLKNEPGADIMTYGGANMASYLIKENLIDEYHFFINPIVVGNGLPVFKEVSEKLSLQLVKSTAFDCGIVVLCYQKK